jgi:hypothetical protein
VHAPELFFTIDSCAFHVAYLVIVFAWLYRHVKKEVRRRDASLPRWAYTTTKEVSMALLSLEQAEFKIKREAGLMKKKYPRQYHAQIEQNLSSAFELVRRHENAAELDVSDELRFGLPSLPIRKRNGTPGRKPNGAGKGRRRTSRP